MFTNNVSKAFTMWSNVLQCFLICSELFRTVQQWQSTGWPDNVHSIHLPTSWGPSSIYEGWTSWRSSKCPSTLNLSRALKEQVFRITLVPQFNRSVLNPILFLWYCLNLSKRLGYVYRTQIRHSKHQCNESLTMMRLQEIYLNKDKKNSPPSILCRHTMPRSVFLLPTWDYNGWSVTDGWGGDQIAQNYPLRWGEPAWQVWVGKKPLEAKKTRKFQTLYTFQIKSRSLMFCLTQ